MENGAKYDHYTLEDFICDEGFQDWVLHPTEHHNLFWQKWISENPEKEELIRFAAQVLSGISFRENFPPEEKVKTALEDHLQAIDQLEADRIYKRAGIRRRLWAAAIITGLLALGYSSYQYWHLHAKITVSTAYGQLKSFYLPDSSLITLNAHSTLKYPRYWSNKNSREVWLEGQAYFRVNHTTPENNHVKNGSTFIVHTNGLNVQVLGTVFDVKSYQGFTDVMLRQGNVRINFTHTKQKDILLSPGDLIRYDAQKNKLVKSTTDPKSYAAWTDRKIILNGMSVKDMVQQLQAFYGYTIIIKDTAIGNKNMEGLLMLDNLSDVIFALSTSLDIKIEQKGDTLLFERKNSSTGK